MNTHTQMLTQIYRILDAPGPWRSDTIERVVALDERGAD